MIGVRHDCQLRARSLRAVETPFSLAAAKLFPKLNNMIRSYRVLVREYQQGINRERAHLFRKVISLFLELAGLTKQALPIDFGIELTQPRVNDLN